MPKLVIINGKPGTGKSTLANRLKSELSIPVMGKDDLKEFLFETTNVKDREWSHVVGKTSVEMLYAFTEQTLQAGQHVAIENAFWADFAIERLSTTMSKSNTTCLEIYCDADQETRAYRHKQRLENGERHEVHLQDELVIDDTIDNERYRPLQLGEVIRVDTTQLDEAGYIEIIRKVEQFLAQS